MEIIHWRQIDIKEFRGESRYQFGVFYYYDL